MHKNYGAALAKFKEELKKEVAPAPPLAPNEFQSRLRQAVVATLNRARTNSVKLPDKFQLGFDEFTTAMPKTGVAPLLGQNAQFRLPWLRSRLPRLRERGVQPAVRSPQNQPGRARLRAPRTWWSATWLISRSRQRRARREKS